jgi:phenylacetate-CoA ligase
MLERFAPFIESRVKNKRIDAEKTTRFLSSSLVQRYLKKYQLYKLKKTIQYSYSHSPFYHKMFNDNNISPHDIKSFTDLRKIPLTKSTDLQHPEKFFAVSKEKFIKIFSSSGTTGKPKRIFFTKEDLNNQIRGIQTGLRLLYDIRPQDSVRVTYDHGYSSDDWGVRYCMERSIEKTGALSVLTGSRLSAKKELELMKTYNISIIMGTPSYLNSLTYDLKNIFDLKQLKIREIMVGTEPLNKEIRKTLETSWNVPVYQGYGLTEMGTSIAGECKEQQGMHVSEGDFLVEVIDPDTEEILEPGNVGELVFTTLARKGMPILRYRTRDLGMILPDECHCGLPFKRIVIKGRTDKMITIGSGDNIYPTIFDSVLLKIPSVIDYQIILDRKENKDHLTVIVESENKSEDFKNQIKNALLKISELNDGINQSKTIHIPDIKIVKRHTIDRKSVKARKVIDKRQLYE